jgi:hypothetical protein
MRQANQLPRRIILSRKGWDSAWGGRASEIVDGIPRSRPIPEHKDQNKAQECGEEHTTFGQLNGWARECPPAHLKACVHLDPDIRPELRPNGSPVSGRFFGQTGAALQHLKNQNVGTGDIFLFYGWFRVKGESIDRHVIWGWLEVEKALCLEKKEDLEEAVLRAPHHPHVKNSDDYKDKNRKGNVLYVAKDKSAFREDLPGAGVFRFTDKHSLTRHGKTRSHWRLPSVVSELGLTYNGARFSENDYVADEVHFRSADIGQEFVIAPVSNLSNGLHDASKSQQQAISRWLNGLFRTAVA